jgi:hypothetical protein
MPHLPDSHHDHDLALVAALAAGDAQGRDHTRATELVTACTECAVLRDDLVALATELRTLPAPRRTRDFRLTADQAAALRPTGWRRLLGAFSGSGFRFATPVGTAMATLGIAGLLLSTVPSTLPAGTTGDGTSGNESYQALSQEASAPAASTGPAAIGPAPQGEVPAASEAAPSAAASASAAPAPSASAGSAPGRYETDQSSGSVATGPGGAAAASSGPAATTDITGETDTQLAAPPSSSTTTASVAPRSPAADRSLVLVASLLLVAGLGLVALRYTARRIA